MVTRTDGCANDGVSNNIAMYVLPSPTIGSSYLSKNTVCTLGTVVIANNTNTNGGGVWSSSNTNVAIISTNAGSGGSATAIANGTATLTYTKTSANGCTSTASATLTVAAVTSPNSISGTNSICKGATTQLSTT